MDTLHADLAHVDDPHLVGKIMAKRQSEAERRARIYDVKTRTIGLDTKTLEKQLEEKRQIAAVEKHSDDKYMQAALLFDQIAMVCEHEKAMAQRQMQKDCQEFSTRELRKEKRREFALSDPDALKKDLPARVGDDDPRCGPASVQQFEGERIEADKTVNRKGYQDLQKHWLTEQIEEKLAIANAEKARDQDYDNQVIVANHVRGVMESHLEETQRTQKKAESDFNLALAAEHRERQKHKREKEAEANAQHVNWVMTDPMLQEGGGETQYDMYGNPIRSLKGLSAEQKHDVYYYNALQMQHKRNVKKGEQEEEAAHAESVSKGVAVLGAVERHRKQLEIQRRQMLDAENSVIAQAQRNMQQHLKGTYANTVTNEYFDKFNSGAR